MGTTTTGDRLVVGFVSLLRLAGVSVSLSRAHAFAEALAVVGTDTRDDVYWSGRATLLSEPDDVAIYDSAFTVFWERRIADPSATEPAPPQPITLLTDDEADVDDQETEDPDGGPVLQVRYSSTEVLRSLDFASCSDDELDQLHALMTKLRFRAHTRPSRRLVATHRRSGRPDLRRTIRKAMQTGGEPIRRVHRIRDQKPRRLVLLVDVSGSMESYARALLRFAHAAVVGRTRVEAFTIGTRLTRVTRELQSKDPDAAMVAASETVRDWSGGTRLGETMKDFNNQWGVRGLARGAVVVVLSDGWDRGDPAVLEAEMARLHRVTHRLIWVNPLKHTPGYAPLARGMAAALPHVDHFVEGHAYDSLEQLIGVISR
jgi:uncharacterized protein with von Willebrand factor type A (vWA) domain